MDEFVAAHPAVWWILTFAVVTFPQWLASIWSLFSNQPFLPWLAQRFGLPVLRTWYLYFITVPVGFVMIWFVLYTKDVTRTAELKPLDRRDVSLKNKDEDRRVQKLEATEQVPKPPTALEGLRQKHHLRSLSELEDWMSVKKLPNGIYGFSSCSTLLRARPAFTNSLEIHKHHDETIHYVGYASDEHIGKFLAHRNDFTLTLFPNAWEGARSIIEIPGQLVFDCDLRPFRQGYMYDLEVRERLTKRN